MVQVSLFNGKVTIPHEAYLAMVRFPHTQQEFAQHVGGPTSLLELKYEGVPPEDTEIRKNGSNGHKSIGDIVDSWLAEKARVSLRRKQTFGRTPTNRYHSPDSKPIVPPHVEIAELYQDGMTTKRNSWGTNQILEEILGVKDGSARTRFLIWVASGKNDDNYGYCVKGADIVRAAFHLAQYYGLRDNYSETPQKMKGIFMAIIRSVSEGSVQLTDSLIRSFGLEKMPDLMRRYEPFRELDVLVQKGSVYAIASAKKIPELKNMQTPALLHTLGYELLRMGGTPVLYYKPCTK